MCAIEAGKRGRSVLVLDHAARLGRKITISGGGRCNFTNLHAGPENYLSSNPGFCKSALARYSPGDFLALIEKHRVPFHEKKLGQQFCNDSSDRIVAMLLDECREARVELRTDCRVISVEKNDGYRIATSQGGFSCDALVVATGGLSFPKLGATDFGHRIAKQFGLALTEIRPALVPLTFSSEDLQRYGPLSGVSIPAAVRHRKREFRENILFTHRGLSGPAILQISSYWSDGEPLEIDLLPDLDAAEWLLEHQAEPVDFEGLLSRHLPRRFAGVWCKINTPDKAVNRCKSQELRDIGKMLNHWTLRMNGTEGYAKAEVTLGGVDTRGLSSKTMEARNVPGLYFIGEVVDVTGWLGGFNFQWAWASGHAAGQFV